MSTLYDALHPGEKDPTGEDGEPQADLFLGTAEERPPPEDPWQALANETHWKIAKQDLTPTDDELAAMSASKEKPASLAETLLNPTTIGMLLGSVLVPGIPGAVAGGLIGTIGKAVYKGLTRQATTAEAATAQPRIRGAKIGHEIERLPGDMLAGMSEQLKDVIQHPQHALPMIAMMTPTILAAAVPGAYPVKLAATMLGPTMQSLVGRAIGLVTEDWIDGKNPLNAENFHDLLTNTLFSFPLNGSVQAVKRVIQSAAVQVSTGGAKDMAKALARAQELAPTIIQPRLDVHDQLVADVIRKSTIAVLKERYMAFYQRRVDPFYMLPLPGQAANIAQFSKEEQAARIFFKGKPQDVLTYSELPNELGTLGRMGRNLKALGALEEANGKPVQNAGPTVKIWGAISGGGGPQAVLRKTRDPAAIAIADIGLAHANLVTNGAELLEERAGALLTKHMVTDEDAQMLDMFKRHPQSVADVKSGKVVLSTADGLRFARLQKFADEWEHPHAGVTPPLFMFRRAMNPDPEKLGMMQSPYLFSSSVSINSKAFLEADLARLQDQSARGLAPQVAGMQYSFDDLMTLRKRQLSVINDQVDIAEKSLDRLNLEFQRTGKFPLAVSTGATKPSNLTMPISPDLKANVHDFIHGTLRQASLDSALPTAWKYLQQVKDPAAMELAGKFIWDLTGQRRAAALQAMSVSFKGLVTSDQLAKGFDAVRDVAYLGNIALNAKFPIVNLTQNMATAYILAGPEVFFQGLADVRKDFAGAEARAVAAQALTKHDVIRQGMLEGEGKTGIGQLGEKLQLGARQSEKGNRVLGYHLGELVAEKAGLKGNLANEYATSFMKMAHFGWGVAERPVWGNMPVTATVNRFRSFSAHYGNFVGHLWRTDKPKAIDAVVMAIALSGTSGIPMYSFFRQDLSKATGIAWPEINPIDEVTGLDLGVSASPFLNIPQNPYDVLGVTAGPLARIASGVLSGQPEDIAKGIKQGIGSGPSRALAGTLELASGGVTRTAHRKILSQRTVPQVLASMAGISPSVRSQRTQLRINLENAMGAKDFNEKRRLLREGRAAGQRNLGLLSSQARGANTKAKTVDILSYFR